MIRSEEFEWICAFCRLHRPPLRPIQWYVPSGHRDNHELDAILEMEDGLTRVAIEATRCYRGNRALGEAKIEDQFLDRFKHWLKETAVACLGARGYRITFTVYLPGPRGTLISRLKDFLQTPERQRVTRAAIENALREAERRSNAVRISCDADAGMSLESALFHRGSQVYVEHIDPTDSTKSDFDIQEQASDSQWCPFIPMSVWIDPEALIGAIDDKRAKLVRYRELAMASGAHALWLLLVVEDPSGWDILAALGDKRLQTTLAGQPQFDEVDLLARAESSSSEGSDLRRHRLHYEGEPSWRLERIWPFSVGASTTALQG